MLLFICEPEEMQETLQPLQISKKKMKRWLKKTGKIT